MPFSVERPQEAQKRDWARLEPYFVTFVLFVVELFTPFAGQRELSRERPGEGSLAGPVRSLSFMEVLDSEFGDRLLS